MNTNKEEVICWYHGKLSREEAENKLKNEAEKDGTFLVRESNSSPGDYVLCILHDDQVSHYQIRRCKEDFFSIEDTVKTHGLDSLIEYYESGHTIDGLQLTQPLKGEAPPSDLRRNGRTNLLHRATKEVELNVVTELLKAGYRLDAKNQDGQTAVHLASMRGANDILQELIDYGANCNSRDTAGYTPLHYACQYNYRNTVKLLLQNGKANIQARNTENDWVPLHYAASRGHKEIVQELLRSNAPVNPRTRDDKVPAQLARESGFNDCALILETYKCPTPKTDRSQWYHGTLDRQEAEKLISKYDDRNGTFLVRYSERNKGSVLTLYHENNFFNYIIKSKDKYLFIDDGPYLETLEHIIEYYSFLPDGLPTTLEVPVPPSPKPPVPEFDTIPRLKKKAQIHVKVQKERSEEYNCTESQNSSDVIPSQFQNIKFSSNFQLNLPPGNVDNNNTNEEYIPIKHLKMGDVIGTGEFGSVYKGTLLKNGERKPVAIKTLLNETVGSNREAFLNEAQLMMRLNHHCVVKLIGLSLGPPLLMVQELIPLGSLLAYIITHKDDISPTNDFTLWAAQIACGMQYLEEQRFIHRDLAARNILLQSRNQAKISDFGLSKALGADHQYYKAMHGGKWPLKWYAPESYNYGTFSHKSDVWSFGVTIWEMFSYGQQPYGDLKGSEAIKLIENNQRLEQPKDCPDHIYTIMRQCWEYDAKNRPTFKELLDKFTSDTEYMNIRELLAERNLS